MKIGRNNISFMAIRTKLIRSRKTKMGAGTSYTARTNQSAKITSARTLAQKKAIMQAGNKKTSASGTILEKTKKNYTDMELAAKTTMKYLEKLLHTEEESRVETDTVADFVQAYNEMMDSINEEGGTVNNMYLRQLHGYAVSVRSKLEQIGITENDNGTLKLDKKVLQNAETEKVKELFQGEGSYADKLLDRIEKVKENARTNLNSMNHATYSSLLESYKSSGNYFNFKA